MLKEKMINMFGRSVLKVKKFSPEILVVGGVVGMVAATIMAVKKTNSYEYNEIICDHYEKMEHVDDALKIAEKDDTKVYGEKEAKSDRVKVYRDTTISMAKLYFPAVAVEVISIGMIFGGFGIIRKRHTAVMAAYSIVDKAFKDYRSRVVKELGADKDTHFMHDTEELESKVTITNEDGTTTKIKKTEQILNGNVVSMYGRVFEDGSTNQWVKSATYNWLYIKKKKDYLNDMLRIRGHVFLNEVYDELGFNRTSAGSQVGWVKKNNGDGYISFGPWCESVHEVEAMGRESSIVLDFNVDGVIYDLIEHPDYK